MVRRAATVDDTPRIDIRDMRKSGMLRPGSSGTLSWRLADNSVGLASYNCHDNKLCLNAGSFGSNVLVGTQDVRFDATPCNYGGQRRWFLCPGCNRRVAVLCGVGGLFRCRHCHHLPYLSQNVTMLRRLMRRRQYIESRIFEDGVGMRRRKGLHRQTFARGLARYLAIAGQINGLHSVNIGRLRAAMQSR